MPIEIVMPRLGWTMEEGTLVEWLKRNGETIESEKSSLRLKATKR